MKKHHIILLFAGWLIFSCKTSYRPDRETVTANRSLMIPADRAVQKQAAGVDFVANGSEPLPWSLEIDLEKGFYFTPSSGRLFIAPPAPALVSGENRIYQSETDSGRLVITISQQPCNTAMSKKNGTTVTVKLRDTEYKGCGASLYDFRINDAWVLESIDAKPLAAGDAKNPPIIEINMLENKVQGFDGCRRFSGSINVEGNHISFSDFSYKGRDCSGNLSSRLFAEKLHGQVVDYSVREGKLHLYLSDDSKLIFSKY